MSFGKDLADMRTFNLEESLRLGASHLESLVDEQGRTYFNIFWTTPAEAVFDWPDYVDLPARYIEAAMMVEPVLGRKVTTVPALRKWLYSMVEQDGLAYRPNTKIADHWGEPFDQARFMYMLVTCLMHNPDDREVRTLLQNLCQGIYARTTFEKEYAYIEKIGVYFGGTLIRPLVQAGLLLNEPKWIDLAGGLAKGIIDYSPFFAPDGSFEGHHHGHLGTLAGILAYAIVTNNTHLKDRVVASFNWSRSQSTASGFVPEVAQRKDDLIMCETCTLMDYLDVALLLARHVSDRYWDVVEKATRNQLVESQIQDASWLAEDPKAVDEEDIIRTNLRQRVVGSFAGWAGPHAQLGVAEEQQRFCWVKSPELRPRYWGKIRGIQNCCAGAGIRALHQVWTNIATFKDHRLDVNMLIDKQVPAATITSFIPYRGQARIEMKQAGEVRVRVSADLEIKDVQATVNGKTIEIKPEGSFINAGKLAAGDVLEVKFPLPLRTEHFMVGNKGFQQYHFKADWKGDTVVAMHADADNPKTGFSHSMGTRTPVFYGPDAPGPMYQRKYLVSDTPNVPASQPVLDTGVIDWYSLPASPK